MKFLCFFLVINLLLIFEKVITLHSKNENIPVNISYKKIMSSSRIEKNDDYIPEKTVISQELFNGYSKDKVSNQSQIFQNKKSLPYLNSLNSKNTDFSIDFNNRLKRVEQHLISKIKNENLHYNKGKIKNRLEIKSNTNSRINGKFSQENEKINITSQNDQEIRNSEKFTDLPNSNKIFPNYKIISQNTTLKIVKDKTYAEVNESVKFEFSHGTFSSIIRKISLGGTSDSLIAFKLTSNDIKIKEVKLINDCLETEENSINNNELSSIGSGVQNNLSISNMNYLNYICVIALFDEINAIEESQVIEIQYNYFAQNILRISTDKNYIGMGKTMDMRYNIHNETQFEKNEKSINDKVKNISSTITQENNFFFNNEIIWYLDNYKRIQPINDIKLMIVFHNTTVNFIQEQKLNNSSRNNNHIIIYPENNFKGRKTFTSNQDTVFTWEFSIINKNEIQKVSLHLPGFNHKCRKKVVNYSNKNFVNIFKN